MNLGILVLLYLMFGAKGATVDPSGNATVQSHDGSHHAVKRTTSRQFPGVVVFEPTSDDTADHFFLREQVTIGGRSFVWNPPTTLAPRGLFVAV